MVGGKKLVYPLVIIILIIPTYAIDVRYIDYYDYYYGDEYGYWPYLDYDLEEEDEETYMGYKVKEPVDYYYCKTPDGDEIGFWQECTNPFYTEGIRLSETKKKLGYNVDPGRKWDYYFNKKKKASSIRVVYT